VTITVFVEWMYWLQNDGAIAVECENAIRQCSPLQAFEVAVIVFKL
jgi:hypothetical protein